MLGYTPPGETKTADDPTSTALVPSKGLEMAPFVPPSRVKPVSANDVMRALIVRNGGSQEQAKYLVATNKEVKDLAKTVYKISKPGKWPTGTNWGERVDMTLERFETKTSAISNSTSNRIKELMEAVKSSGVASGEGITPLPRTLVKGRVSDDIAEVGGVQSLRQRKTAATKARKEEEARERRLAVIGKTSGSGEEVKANPVVPYTAPPAAQLAAPKPAAQYPIVPFAAPSAEAPVAQLAAPKPAAQYPMIMPFPEQFDIPKPASEYPMIMPFPVQSAVAPMPGNQYPKISFAVPEQQPGPEVGVQAIDSERVISPPALPPKRKFTKRDEKKAQPAIAEYNIAQQNVKANRVTKLLEMAVASVDRPISKIDNSIWNAMMGWGAATAPQATTQVIANSDPDWQLDDAKDTDDEEDAPDNFQTMAQIFYAATGADREKKEKAKQKPPPATSAQNEEKMMTLWVPKPDEPMFPREEKGEEKEMSFKERAEQQVSEKTRKVLAAAAALHYGELSKYQESLGKGVPYKQMTGAEKIEDIAQTLNMPFDEVMQLLADEVARKEVANSIPEPGSNLEAVAEETGMDLDEVEYAALNAYDTMDLLYETIKWANRDEGVEDMSQNMKDTAMKLGKEHVANVLPRFSAAMDVVKKGGGLVKEGAAFVGVVSKMASTGGKFLSKVPGVFSTVGKAASNIGSIAVSGGKGLFGMAQGLGSLAMGDVAGAMTKFSAAADLLQTIGAAEVLSAAEVASLGEFVALGLTIDESYKLLQKASPTVIKYLSHPSTIKEIPSNVWHSLRMIVGPSLPPKQPLIALGYEPAEDAAELVNDVETYHGQEGQPVMYPGGFSSILATSGDARLQDLYADGQTQAADAFDTWVRLEETKDLPLSDRPIDPSGNWTETPVSDIVDTSRIESAVNGSIVDAPPNLSTDPFGDTQLDPWTNPVPKPKVTMSNIMNMLIGQPPRPGVERPQFGGILSRPIKTRPTVPVVPTDQASAIGFNPGPQQQQLARPPGSESSAVTQPPKPAPPKPKPFGGFGLPLAKPTGPGGKPPGAPFPPWGRPREEKEREEKGPPPARPPRPPPRLVMPRVKPGAPSGVPPPRPDQDEVFGLQEDRDLVSSGTSNVQPFRPHIPYADENAFHIVTGQNRRAMLVRSGMQNWEPEHPYGQPSDNPLIAANTAEQHIQFMDNVQIPIPPPSWDENPSFYTEKTQTKASRATMTIPAGAYTPQPINPDYVNPRPINDDMIDVFPNAFPFTTVFPTIQSMNVESFRTGQDNSWFPF